MYFQILLDNGIVCTFGMFVGSPDKAYALLLRLWKSNERFLNRSRQFALSKFESQTSLIKVNIFEQIDLWHLHSNLNIFLGSMNLGSILSFFVLGTVNGNVHS